MSDKAELVILIKADLKWLSKVWRARLSADGEQCNRCSTFGELNEALKRVRASCAPIEASLSVATGFYANCTRRPGGCEGCHRSQFLPFWFRRRAPFPSRMTSCHCAPMPLTHSLSSTYPSGPHRLVHHLIPYLENIHSGTDLVF